MLVSKRAYEGPLTNSCEVRGAFFCRDITALSITQYPFAHYARNCGPIACFTLYLCTFSRPGEERALEFFLPAPGMDNHYPQTLLNSIWAKMKGCLPNWKVASGEKLGEVISVEVINSSTCNEPESFEISQHNSSLPHLEGSEYTRTLNLFENNTGQSSNSYTCEEAATGETPKRVPNVAFQPKPSEQHFEFRGNTVPAERNELVEESTIEDTSCATSDVHIGCAIISNIDIPNAMTIASQPFRFQTTKKPTQQEEETVILETEGDTFQQLPRISQLLFQCGTEQDTQVREMIMSTPNIHSYEGISKGIMSERTPEDVEQIISLVDELEECIEPPSLTSQPRSSTKIFSDEG